ncbi:DUF6932 family protein [Brevundimonas faecalis]|uniref:DUF6932 family protein n=1 Tax=Brevundimonas faecalis TaxID=947378 RepID=UPI00362019F8
MEDAYRKARTVDFPLFPEGGDAATPFNAYPFHARFSDLETDWTFSQARCRLVQALGGVIIDARTIGVRPAALLIGGSFADRAVDAPADLDTVIYYSSTSGDSAGLALGDLQHRAKHEAKIDCRFIPIDVDPLVIIRATAFFSILYAAEQMSRKVTRPPIYVDLDGDDEPQYQRQYPDQRI